MVGLPIDLTKVSAADVFPDGRYRVRVIRAEVYPKDKELGSDAEVVGEVNEKGKQKYAFLGVSYRFVEHPSNYTTNPTTGEPMSLVGREIGEPISFHPEYRKHIRELYDNTGTDAGEDPKELLGKELDIYIKNKPSREDPSVKESSISSRRVANG